ncbi:nucleotidyltransferase family protein [Microbacterium sp.]|uniref:nucleotidyltransferase family protein n=1 Tax=Microbacterium sp. TaxID=51671 RepID=UPI0039E3FBAA
MAIAFGVLDVSDCDDFGDDADILVVPARPGVPLALHATGAGLWRRLVAASVPDEELDEDERVVVREMAEAGLATTRHDHPARVRVIAKPWLVSPMHELVYALVQSVAREHGIRSVFIKGPVLHRQGLRDREHSGDVDVWVEPGSEGALAEAMAAWGWTVVPFDFASVMYHSLTLESPGWGCEIDVHFRYPGVGADTDKAFALLSETAETYEFGGVRALAPAPTFGAIISALHAVRPDPKWDRGESGRSAAVLVLQRAGEGCIDDAARWGALPALVDVMAAAFPDTRLPEDVGPLPADWIRRQAPSAIAYHLAVLRSLPWRERPLAVFRTIWPSARTAQLSSATRGKPVKSPLKARLSRLGYGVKLIWEDSARSVARRRRNRE